MCAISNLYDKADARNAMVANGTLITSRPASALLARMTPRWSRWNRLPCINDALQLTLLRWTCCTQVARTKRKHTWTHDLSIIQSQNTTQGWHSDDASLDWFIYGLKRTLHGLQHFANIRTIYYMPTIVLTGAADRRAVTKSAWPVDHVMPVVASQTCINGRSTS